MATIMERSHNYDSRTLQDIPDIISPEDREQLASTTLDLQARVVLYEELIERYPSQPYLLARLAELLYLLGAGTLSINLQLQAQSILLSTGLSDGGLDAIILNNSARVDKKVNRALVKSREAYYYQKWRPTRQHQFPTGLPHLPEGAEEIQLPWEPLTGKRTGPSAGYLIKLAIETNHLENTFFLTEESAEDLVRRGISEATVDCLPKSAIQDPVRIKCILNDMLEAYDLLDALVENTQGISEVSICAIHSSLMRTCRFSGEHYVAAGKTRTETRKTAVVTGAYSIECCPFPEVDTELAYICRMAKQWIKSWKNPFATASWMHLVLVRCHPFEDGNGRLVRLLASIPLIRHGFPPISISLTQRADYYTAINKAYEGDHAALVECIVQGMQETVASVKAL